MPHKKTFRTQLRAIQSSIDELAAVLIKTIWKLKIVLAELAALFLLIKYIVEHL